MKKTNVIIFGVGIAGRAIYRTLKDDKNITIVGFIDNNNSIHNTNYDNKPIFNPDNITSINFDKIIIAGVWYDTMIAQLCDLGISNNKIWKFDDKDTSFNSSTRIKQTDYIVSNIYQVTKLLSINCYMIGSSLATLFRKRDLSSVADVDTFMLSQKDGENFYNYIINNRKFKDYEIIKILFEEDTLIEKKDTIKKIIIKSKHNINNEEPTILDISIATCFDNKYLITYTENYLFIPKVFCTQYRTFSYKNIDIQIPTDAEKYLQLGYGDDWIVQPKSWAESDYGNLITPSEITSILKKEL